MSGKGGLGIWKKDSSKPKGMNFYLQLPDEYEQQMSSRCYPLGFAICRLCPEALKKYGYEGNKRKARLHVGYDQLLEPPPARPASGAPALDEEQAAAKISNSKLQKARKRRRYEKNKNAADRQKGDKPQGGV